MALITLSSGRQFTAHADESLLDAGLRAGVTLPHSCRTGRCSSCKARVLDGSTTATQAESGLTPAEREAGWVLSCVRSADTDVALEIEDLGDLRLPAARTLPCRIDSLEPLAEDVLKVQLRLPPTAGFEPLPGQYLEVLGPAGLRRSYSIANLPSIDKRVELHIRRVPGGAMSDYWFEQARANDLLRLHGPAGSFVLRELAGLDLIFLATGTGIAPVKAMLEGLQGMAGQMPRSVTVYWGGRLPQDLYWRPAAGAVRFVPVLSRADSHWPGRRGHVQDALLADTPELGCCAVYACGSDLMIDSAREQLLARGLPARRFHADAFVCSATP